MPAAKKEGEAQSFAEAMQIMGVQNPVIPADADSSDLNQPQAEAKDGDSSQKLVQPANIKQPEIEASEAETTEDTEQEDAAEEDDQEVKRRAWQSRAEKAKQLAEQKEQEANTYLQALEIEKQKSNYLMQLLAGAQQVRQPEPKAKPKPDKEPELWDFIAKDQYDRDEIGDPSTPSGKAYQNWLDARADYRAEKKYQQLEAQRQEQQARDVTLKQAKALAKEFPEFSNPFTGEPDIPKIQEWLDGLSRVDWVTIKRALDGKKAAVPMANGESAKVLTADAEIGRRASKPTAVAGQSSSSPAGKKVPAELKKLQEMFGNNFVLPKDAAF